MSSVKSILEGFKKMGATAMVNLHPTLARNMGSFTVDVQTNSKKEQRFIINASPAFELQVLDVNPKDRHLVLMVKETRPSTRKHSPPTVITHKFLCGHDERHWFVAAVPGGSVHDVVSAKEALQPREVREKVSAKIAKPSKRFTRNNEVFKRQGEWFFVPTTIEKIDTLKVRFNEPMVRPGGGKPHIAERAYRVGGTSVYVKGAETITPEEYFKLDKKKSDYHLWRPMVANPKLYVSGKVSHPDHKTIDLKGWYLVLVNTESEAASKKHMLFLD